jgi:hypothetical protein
LHKTLCRNEVFAEGFHLYGFRGLDHGVSPGLFIVIDGEKASLLILRLSKTYQKVMRMRHMQDLSLSEISLITGQSKNAVAVQLHRGLEKLKVLYHDEGSLSC